MSQADDSEDDIWEYKPLSKKKKSHESFPATASTSKESFKKHKSSARDVKLTESHGSVPGTSVHKPGSINKGRVPDTSVHNPGSINKGHVPGTSVHNPGSINKGHVPDTSVYNPGSIGKVRVPDTSVTNPGSISKGYTPEMNPGQSDQEAYTESHALCSRSPEPTGDGATESDFCPICQMPFSILVSQSQMGHVAACLDTTRDDALECPDGLQCSSNILIHYERYNHTSLAHSRAVHDSVLMSLSKSCRTTGGSGSRSPSLLESSQGSPAFSSSLPNPRLHLASTPTRLTSSLSNHNASPVGGHLALTPSQTKNGLLLLRSPRLEDFKKKKGWMTPREPKAKGAGRKTNPTVSSRPGAADRKPGSQGADKQPGSQGADKQPDKQPDKPEPPPFDYDSISFSPLSELPAELESEEEVEASGVKKALFPPSVSEKNGGGESEDSLELFSDDEFLNDFVERLGSQPVAERAAEPASLPGCSTQLETVGSFGAPCNQPASAAAVDSAPGSTRRAAGGTPAADTAQSPQSVVLERLRQTLSAPNGFSCQSVSSSNHDNHNKALGSSQTASPTSARAMAPRKPALSQGKAGQGPGLKQTDIGVFFGLKPLKDPQGEPGSASQSLNATDAAAARIWGPLPPYPGGGSQRGGTRVRRPRGERGPRKRGAGPAGVGAQEAAAGSSSTNGGGPSGEPAGAPGEGPRGGRRTGRARWNRGGADSDGTRRCPFYKKIPGTGFAVDAFSYGVIEGISSYFLTHFHSDHYGGLTRTSTVPIYCNKITGNLVRSKLKVAEQYLHILPMNTRVTVDRVGVILMEANHCPGAAMLLFFLPDGQIVLHTGDFRADPTMESYPELLSCRVQTLYLDTTYCSPEYTFPRQQEAISFAANTAFELVALHPRTLVVCGSYSVGKEKVFLALAEVLGSKVCLSRDKYNTMCCLESEPIRKQLTTDWKAAQVHVLPMMQLTVKKLQDHLRRFSTLYDRLVAFKPTGWTFSQQMDSVDDIRPQISGNITVYGVPYSEHSSFLEMKRFVQWLRPLKIIPTVNAGSWATRQAMEKCFREWLAEGGAKH